MQIQYPSMKSIDEERTEDSHEAGQDNQVRFVFFQGFDSSFLCIVIEPGIEWAGVQVTVFDIVALGDLENSGFPFVGQDGDDLGVSQKLTGFRLNDCLGIRALART